MQVAQFQYFSFLLNTVKFHFRKNILVNQIEEQDRDQFFVKDRQEGILTFHQLQQQDGLKQFF